MKHLIKTTNEEFNSAKEFAKVLLANYKTEKVFIKNVDTNEVFEVVYCIEDYLGESICTYETIHIPNDEFTF